MVVKLLEISKGTTREYPFEKVDTSEILKDVCDSMSFRAERYKKSINSDIQEDLYVYGDDNRIRQLFINLLDNAIKYSSPFSQINISAELVKEKIILKFMNPSNHIEQEQFTNLFQPFFSINQEKAEEGSVGLGLSIAKSIVEDHKGIIRIFNENQNTIVYVEMIYMKDENLL